jgi:signal transduction histidine kinase
MVSVVALVPRDERPLVRAHANQLQPVAARIQGVSQRLRRRTCMQVAAIAPHLTSDRLSVLLRHALWSYWLDNRLDSRRTDLAAAGRLRDGLTAVTIGDETRPTEPLLAELAQIVRELSRYDETGDVMKWYGAALRDTLAADLHQRVARLVRADSGRLPNAEQYLAVAAETVNYRSFAFALLATGGEPLTGRQLQCLDAALQQASRAVRLANDLRSLARDERAGTLNVLQLRTASGNSVTTSYVWDEVHRSAEAHDAALRALTSTGVVSQAPTGALTRTLAQSIRLYRSTDLR